MKTYRYNHNIRETIVRDFRDGELTLGASIRQLRKQYLGLTQRELAINAWVAVGTLAALERESERISLANLTSVLEPMNLHVTIEGEPPGARVRNARKTQTHLTQVDFAESAGVAAGTLAAFENGQLQISLHNASKILELLEVELQIDPIDISPVEPTFDQDRVLRESRAAEARSDFDRYAPTLAQMLGRAMTN